MTRELFRENIKIRQGATDVFANGATLTIRNQTDDAISSIYTFSSDGVSSQSNPFVIDSEEGLARFYIDVGRYYGQISGPFGSSTFYFSVAHSSPVISIEDGGTNASSAADARTNLGVPSTATVTAIDGRVTVLEGLGNVPSGGSAGQVLAKIDGTDYNTEWAAAAGGTVDTSGTPVALDFARFTDATTVEGRSYAEVLSDLSLDTVVKYDATATFTAGYIATSYNAGTMTTGTLTPDAADGNFQHYINGGAHTLAVPSGATTIVLDVTNNGSAGAITTSAYDIVDGDTMTTTDTEAFRLFISVGNAGSTLTVKAMQ